MKSTPSIIIAVVAAFLLGGAATLFVVSQRDREPVPLNDAFLGELFDDEFFQQSRDPFREMDRLRQRMDKLFAPGSGARFDPWFKREYGDLSAASIRMREDRKHVIYELDLEDGTLANIDVTTTDGMVNIAATIEATADNSRSVTTVNQRFPIPASVDPNSLTVEDAGDRIVIRFRKPG